MAAIDLNHLRGTLSRPEDWYDRTLSIKRSLLYLLNMLVEICAKIVEINEDSLFIGFSSGEDNEHYFTMQRHEFHREEALANVKSVYWELDEQSWGEYGGIKEVTLSRARLIVHFDLSRPNPHIRYKEIKIAFSVNDSEFQELQNVLQTILLGYEDRLNLIVEYN